MIGCRGNLEKRKNRVQLNSILLLQNYKMHTKWIIVVLKCKKMFLFEKFDEYFQFNSLFLEISKDFLCICIKQVAFLSGDWKKSLEMRERKWYRKETRSNMHSVLFNKVSGLEFDRFEQMSLYTLSWFFANILTKVTNTIICVGFRFDAAKKLSLCDTAII